MNGYRDFSRLDSAMGNYPGAYSKFKMYIVYRDSLVNEGNTKKITQSQMQYKFNKISAADSVRNANEKEVKTEQINAQNAQIEQEQAQRYVLYGGILLVILFSGFLFSRFKVTQKQKVIIEMQKSIVDEKQKEILDSIHYAKRIQQSLLPSDKYIEKNLKRLNKN
jgi:hypothetical protein